MPTATARIPTDRPSRYLVQLCKHFSNRGRHLGPRSHRGGDTAPPAGTHAPPDTVPGTVHVEWSDTQGTLSVPFGRCTLRTETDALLVRAEADDEEGLRRLQDLLDTHIARFGRRDGLRADWHRPREPEDGRREDSAAPPPAAP